jgi:hypothetical protein
MINWKRFGRKWTWANFKVLSCHSPLGPDEKHEKPKSVKPVSGLKFEPGPVEYESGVLTTRPK